MCVCVCVFMRGPKKAKKESLDLESEVVVYHLMWVLETKTSAFNG